MTYSVESSINPIENNNNPPTTEHTYWKGEVATGIVCLVAGILLGHYTDLSHGRIAEIGIGGFLIGSFLNVSIVEALNSEFYKKLFQENKPPVNPPLQSQQVGSGEIKNEQQVLAKYVRENRARLKAEEREIGTEGIPTYILRSLN